jgi:hypothetical protein
VNGNLARISTDRLLDVAQGFGLRVQPAQAKRMSF